MKVLRSIISIVLILIIIGGVGFLAWNIMYNSGNMQGMNMGGSQNNTENVADTTDHNSMSGMQNTTSFDALDIKNKDRLNQVITTINDAVNQITIDPYSKITVPRPNLHQSIQGQQGNTTINIYPNSNNTVNVPPQGSTPSTTTPANPNANIVYSQGKLEQLHNGIFKLSQGMMLLNELNDDLTLQVTNQTPNNYEGYANRYKALYQNKIKLSRSLTLINEGSLLVNVNPYTPGVGYEYDASQMEQLNKGIYKLAQGLFLGVRLGEDFTNQMAQVNSLANMNTMSMSPSFSIWNIDVKLILYILIIVFVLTFVIALFGAVRAAFRPAK